MLIRKKYVLISILLLFGAPIGVNYLVSYNFLPHVYGNGSQWLSFFGNYLGGAISAVVAAVIAYYVAKMQVDSNLKQDRNNRNENNRAFISTTYEKKEWNLGGSPGKDDMIILTFDYDYIEQMGNYSNDFTNVTTFISISFIGDSKIVRNCKLTLLSTEDTVFPDNEFIKRYFHGRSYFEAGVMELALPVAKTNNTIYIPLVHRVASFEDNKKLGIRDHRPLNIHQMTVEYETISGEKLEFFYDVKHKRQCHNVVKSNGEKRLLFEVEMEDISFKYPSKVIVERTEE
ncbi:hypothetical protein [Shouchella hunanensis]|uniref:Uncharacterized protein n=1 Tax=Shouchella hunanensis TaxID=766894 RepID=A0ABY7W4H6_9BACI|nr:hypothetical protein [Shouchella hunanensis]WDF02941.1 hypothetical protein PQ477_15755 [Shouchella hunanensis]